MINPLLLAGYDRKSAGQFLIIGLATQVVYSVDAIREVLYEQYTSYMGINNTELGILFTINSLCYILFLFFGWIHNIFRPKSMVLVGLVTNFTLGLVVFFRPHMGFSALVPIFFLYAVKEVAFWPAILNYVRSFSNPSNQGLTFSLHEFMRRIVSISLSFMAIGCITIVGSAFWGIRLAILIDTIAIGVFTYLVISHVPNIESATPPPSSMKNRLKAYFSLVSNPGIWLIGFCGMASTMNFYILLLIVPLLRNAFNLSPAVSGLVAVLVCSGVGSAASFFGGIISDKVFKSPSRMIKYLLYMLFISTLFMALLPKTPDFLVSSITALSLISALVYMLRGLTFAPVAEMGIPQSMNGASVSIISFIVFSPGLWMHMVNGKLLDIFSNDIPRAYGVMFSMCLAANSLAIFSAHRLDKRLKKNRRLLKEAESLINETAAQN